MNDDFLFGFGKTLKTLRELETEMDSIIKNKVSRDFVFMDKRMVEIYHKPKGNGKDAPPLRSLGKMPIADALRKFG